MRRHTMRVRRSARGRRKQGAVLVMGLLFTLFCVGLMFCILGLEEAVDFREAMQDAADAAALAGAQQYAEEMNRARLWSETEWHYVEAAITIDLLRNAPANLYDPASKSWGGSTSIALGPCSSTSGPSACNSWYNNAHSRAVNAANRVQRGADGSSPSVFFAKGRPLAGARNAVSTVQSALTPAQARYPINVDILDEVGGQGPTEDVLLRCQGNNVGSFHPATLFGSELLATPRDAATGPLRIYNNYVKDFWNHCSSSTGDSSGCVHVNPNDPMSPFIFPKAAPSSSSASGTTNQLSSNDVRGLVKRAIGNGSCLPTFLVKPQHYRVVGRAVGPQPKTWFRLSRSRVFVGAFKSGGEGYENAADYEDNASFKDAGQYALAQASFGLDGNGLFNTSPQAPGIHGVFQAIAVDNTWSQSHGHYSGFPLHLYGTWRANLTRVHFAVNGGDFASTCRGPSGFTCNSPEWAGKIDSAGTH